MSGRVDRVEVWLTSLDPRPSAATLAACHSTLDATERERASRFASEPARDQFVVARSLLRHVLSMHASAIAPGDWHFALGPLGKPTIDAGGPPIEFNLSHADGLVAVAISTAGPVGVDVERVDRAVNVNDFATILSPVELAELATLGGEAQRRRFHSIWTAKEAYAKARGTGLHESLARVTIIDAEASPRLLGDGVTAWRIDRIDARRRHCAAVVSRSTCPPAVRWIAAARLVVTPRFARSG